MVNYIRSSRESTRCLLPAVKTIDLNGGLSEWDDVGPVYTDFVNDTVFRRHFPGEERICISTIREETI